MEVLRVKKLTTNAFSLTKGSKLSAGWDLKAAYDLTIEGNGKGLIKTDISIAIPKGYYGRIAPRSGLSWKKHTDIGAGVIDCDYRGPIGVVLFNLGKDEVTINTGDRVAQLIIEKISYGNMVEVDYLDDTDRGSGGFGSTGE
jgi:dUTP pyrophosphatase